MSEDSPTGIPIKPVKLLDRTVSADFKKIFKALSQGAISFWMGQPEVALKNITGVVDAFKVNPSPRNLSYQLVITALADAAASLTKENSHRFEAVIETEGALKRNPAYQNFLAKIEGVITEGNHLLEYEHIQNPKTLPFLTAYTTYFSDFLKLFAVPEAEAQIVANRLPTYFVYALHNEWRSDPNKYNNLIGTLDPPSAEAARKEKQWAASTAYLQKELADHVLGVSFSLEHIFIPLRAYYVTKPKQRSRREEVHEEKPERIALWLEAQMDQWMANEDAEDNIKVLQGGPGSGKSSFSKIWAAKLAREGHYRTLFFPLHHFNISDNVKSAVGEYFTDSPDVPLNYNPLEEKTDQLTLMIFDGLDELVMQGKKAQDAASHFIQTLKDFCNQQNYKKKRFKILVTGRPIAIQDTEQKLRDGDEQVLHLLPYYLSEKKKEEFRDTASILRIDQRQDWWNNYFYLKNEAQDGLPAELSSTNLEDITREPLLNYLVALSWQHAPEKFNENTNINAVYEQLIKGVYDRDYDPAKKHRSQGDLAEEEFMQILEEIAICAWQGGDARVTTEKKIEKHIANRGLTDLLEDYKASAKSGVSKLLTAFYFRKYGKKDDKTGDEAFEFTHKSFGEYLAARALVELLAVTHEERTDHTQKTSGRRVKQKGWSIEDALMEWLRVTGKKSIDEDLLKFIKNELKIRQEVGSPIDKWQQTISKILNSMIINGIPIHKLERMHHLTERKVVRNSEEALVVMHSCCASLTGKVSYFRIEGFIPDWLNRIASTIHQKDLVFKCLNHLNLEFIKLENCNMSGFNFSNCKLTQSRMAYSKLGQINLHKANLNRSELINANFINADVTDANLNEANLHGANFDGADLSRATMIAANLKSANLTSAKIIAVNLIRANFDGANLKSAHLDRSNLAKASLKRTDLSGANLERVELTNTDLEAALLIYANLTRTNLRYGNLREANLTGAYLTRATLIQVNLTEADLSLADLTGVDLSGADLKRANLEDADLRESNLTRAKNLVYHQLAATKSLYKAKGISSEIKVLLQLEKPQLFEKPDWLEE